MLCLRRVAIRALPLPSTPIAARLRPLTTLTSSVTRFTKQPRFLSPLQRRFASEEATQSESGENASTTEPLKSADEEDNSSILSAIKSAPETAYNKVSEAANSVSGSLGGVAQAAEPNRGSGGELESSTVFIGNLFFHLQKDDLLRAFERIGPVKSTKIVTDPNGQSRGFGYVEFVDPAHALMAVETLHLQNLEGRQMNVQIQKPRLNIPRGERTLNARSKTLFIGNMPFDMSDRDLNNLFSKIKNIVDVRVAIDRRTGQPRGFAHADFLDVESAEQGLAVLKDVEVSGRALRVDYSQSVNKLIRPEATPE